MKAARSKATGALSALGRRTSEPPIAWLMKQTLDHPHLISLAAGFTDSPTLPVKETRAALSELLADVKASQAALQYGAAAGEPVLRRLTAERFWRHDAQALASSPGTTPAPGDASRLVRSPAFRRSCVLPAQAGTPNGSSQTGAQADKIVRAPEAGAGDAVELRNRVLITHGSQQLLYMVSEALCDEGDIVLVEDPTYFVYLGIAQSRAIDCRGVPLREDGIDLEALEQKLAALKRSGDLRRVKLLYLVTYLQNPTGVTTRFATKVAALELLRRYERHAGHPIYLLEDTAYRELRFAGKDEPSALAAGGFGDRVILAGTYSKPFATGIRVGFGILPEPLFTRVLRIKGNHDFGTSNLLQQILVRAIASGRYEKHLAALHARYAAKAAVMKRAMREHFPDWVEWREPEGGLYYWARLPKRLKSGLKSKVFKDALAQDVLYVPGELCYADDPTRPKPNHEMRISFGGASLEDIAEGIARLGRVLNAC